jgi:hypothetical protein
MAAAAVSNTVAREGVWVRLPPPASEGLEISFQSLLFSQVSVGIKIAMKTDEEYRNILGLWE